MHKLVHRERGAVTVEVVILVPLVLLVLGVMVAGWRLWAARSATVQAAEAAARAASIARSGGEAVQRADQVARANLGALGIECSRTAVAPDTADFAKPPGVSGRVGVRVECEVPFADLLVPGMPGSLTVTSNASEQLDTFRERRP